MTLAVERDRGNKDCLFGTEKEALTMSIILSSYYLSYDSFALIDPSTAFIAFCIMLYVLSAFFVVQNICEK